MKINERPADRTRDTRDSMRRLVAAITDELCTLYGGGGRFDFAGADRHLAALVEAARDRARDGWPLHSKVHHMRPGALDRAPGPFFGGDPVGGRAERRAALQQVSRRRVTRGAPSAQPHARPG